MVAKNGDKNILCLFLGMEKIKTCGPKPCKRVNIFCTKSGLLSKRGLQKKKRKKNSDSDTILAEILC